MPASFNINITHGVVFSTGTGVFTHADFVAHMKAVRSDPRFKPELNQLVDCRAITKMELTTTQIKDLASRSLFSPKSRRAFVVSNELQFGMTRMFAAYRDIAERQTVMVFRTLPDALAWLGLPPDFDPNKT